ncbi:MAG: RidA family protein [Phycisphaerales bacterium]|nr:RidA family protein [Phycisphaerales bacterium]
MNDPTSTSPIYPASSASANLQRLGFTLPTPAKPVAAYVPTRRIGNLVYVAGQIPFVDGKLLATGIVGQGVGGVGSVSIELAIQCAQRCALNALAAVAAELGSIDRVKSVVRLGVFVACGPEFTDHPKVANGASELMVQVFGDAGRHARAAVGSSSLPLGAPVEVECVFEAMDV